MCFNPSKSPVFSRRALRLGILVMLLLPGSLLGAGNGNEILLWPNGAPGSEGKTGAEKVRIAQPTGDHVITNINKPSITTYLPPPDE